MTRTLDHVVSDAEFDKQQASKEPQKTQKDTFLTWMLLMGGSVAASHIILSSPATPTGFVTSSPGTLGNLNVLLQSTFVLFIVILVVALIYFGVTKIDRD